MNEGTAPTKPLISIETFSTIELQIAKIISCEIVQESEKLLKLTVDMGASTRTIFAGIKKAYQDPLALIGRHVVVVANLAPRKMRFGVSEGMVLCASFDNAENLFLLSADQGAQAGMRVS